MSLSSPLSQKIGHVSSEHSSNVNIVLMKRLSTYGLWLQKLTFSRQFKSAQIKKFSMFSLKFVK